MELKLVWKTLLLNILFALESEKELKKTQKNPLSRPPADCWPVC